MYALKTKAIIIPENTRTITHAIESSIIVILHSVLLALVQPSDQRYLLHTK